jgi:hypothetical protein
MNVEIGAEAVLFPEKEYINGIALAVQLIPKSLHKITTHLNRKCKDDMSCLHLCFTYFAYMKYEVP